MDFFFSVKPIQNTLIIIIKNTINIIIYKYKNIKYNKNNKIK